MADNGNPAASFATNPPTSTKKTGVRFPRLVFYGLGFYALEYGSRYYCSAVHVPAHALTTSTVLVVKYSVVHVGMQHVRVVIELHEVGRRSDS